MHNPSLKGERLKLHEAVGVVAMVAFAATAGTIMIAAAAAQCVVTDAIDHLKKKGAHHVQ